MHFHRSAECLIRVALLAALVTPAPAWAQDDDSEGNTFIQADPKMLGLEIPDGPVRPGLGRRVLVIDDAGNEIVAKVHVYAGDRSIVMLPDGRLSSVPTKSTQETEKPFKPQTQDELLTELEARFKGFKTRKTRRYIYVYNTSTIFANGTSAILESMYPGVWTYLRRSKVEVQEPEVPLAVIMFKTQEQFNQYRQMPDGVVAYYDGITNNVFMYEQSKLAEIAPELAVKQAISTIAHEGVHQILHNIGVQQRLSRWPMWISEGLPEYFAPTEVKAHKWKGVGKTNDLRMWDLGRFLKAVKGPDPEGKHIAQAVSAPRLTSMGYAWAWGLTHYLARNKEKEFFAYLREMSQIGPLESREIAALNTEKEDTNLDVFQRHFGDDLGQIEALMVRHLQKQPYVDPIANQTHYVVKFLTDTGGSVQIRTGITTSPASIARMQEKLNKELGPLAQRTRIQVQAYPNRAAAEAAANR